MFQESTDKVGTANAPKHSQKSHNEKDPAVPEVTSMNQIDVTKPLSQQEQSIIVAKNNNEQSNSNDAVSNKGSKSIPELSSNGGGNESVDPPKNNKKYATEIVDKFQDNIEKLKIELNSIIKSRPKVVILVLERINRVSAGLISKDFLADESKCENKKLQNVLIQNVKNPEFTLYLNTLHTNASLRIDNTTGVEHSYKGELQKEYVVGNAATDKTVTNEYFNYKTNLSGPVGKNQTNNAADVKSVALKLQEYGISGIPEACLNGDWDSKLENCIKTFQTAPNAGYYERRVYKAWQKGQKGVIKQGDPTFKALFRNFGVEPIYQRINKVNEKIEGDNISLMSYNSVTMEETLSEERDSYNGKLDKLSEGLELRGKYVKIVKMAEMAANDEKYFDEYTKDVSEKLSYNDATISDEVVTLSPLLLSRIRKLHKFLVAAGLYEGDMEITGLRSRDKAHRWSTQYVITQNVSSSTVKNNLIEMYNDATCNDGTNISDQDGNVWAKTEHFTVNADNSVTIDWEAVKAYVDSLSGQAGYRTDPSSPANEGYTAHSSRRPNYARPMSNHCAGKAIDISSTGLIYKTEAMIDLIGLRFGVIRCGGEKEAWHYQLTGAKMTDAEIEEMQNN